MNICYSPAKIKMRNGTPLGRCHQRSININTLTLSRTYEWHFNYTRNYFEAVQASSHEYFRAPVSENTANLVHVQHIFLEANRYFSVLKRNLKFVATYLTLSAFTSFVRHQLVHASGVKGVRCHLPYLICNVQAVQNAPRFNFFLLFSWNYRVIPGSSC